MDKETIHEQIEILIETLKEQHEGMKDHPNYISQIDIDLFLENIRDLYEFSIVLGKLNDRDRKQIQSPPKEKVEIIKNYPKEKEIPVETIHEPIIPIHRDKPKPSESKKKVNKISSGVLFEEFSIAIEETKPKQEKIIQESEAISDIKTAIGINEKFLFMNELFDGSLEEYNASMDLINNCLNASDAEQKIFQELQPKYHWDMNSPNVKSLLTLVERRFI
jgi:hypothetical protein